MTLRKIIARMLQPMLSKLAGWYLARPRKYRYMELEVIVYPSVFHPLFFFSTPIFIEFLERLPLHDRTFLELGGGSGLIALWAVRRGAVVTASDINPVAVQGIEESAATNKLPIEVRQSDLFDDLPPDSFDYIAINPPYFPRAPRNMSERALLCGENFEYFRRLFQQLPAYIRKGSTPFMILSEDCDIAAIQTLAIEESLQLSEVFRKRKWGEQYMVFHIAAS
jgi:release factor glutamine methyltransferase